MADIATTEAATRISMTETSTAGIEEIVETEEIAETEAAAEAIATVEAEEEIVIEITTLNSEEISR